ncbi:MAG: DUF2071 domain-containing protein, partial [Thermoanaerobaculia bacterium]
LTYAYPAELLTPLLPPGLTLDTYEGLGFLAIAMVQTRALRPAGLPRFLGRNFFLSGYRIFARHQNAQGKQMRGLRILRSDTDSRWMAAFGNLLTHYNYRHCGLTETRGANTLSLSIETKGAEADLALHARLDPSPTEPPHGSPFPDLAAARKFAGPLPFTFDYEHGSHSLVIIQGVRTHWTPRPVEVEVTRNTFLSAPPFDRAPVRLANAFYLEDVPYRWEPGVLSKLPGKATA